MLFRRRDSLKIPHGSCIFKAVLGRPLWAVVLQQFHNISQQRILPRHHSALQHAARSIQDGDSQCAHYLVWQPLTVHFQPVVSTDFKPISHAHPLPFRPSPREQQAKALVANIPMSVNLRGLSFGRSVTVSDVLTPTIRRAPYNKNGLSNISKS